MVDVCGFPSILKRDVETCPDISLPKGDRKGKEMVGFTP